MILQKKIIWGGLGFVILAVAFLTGTLTKKIDMPSPVAVQVQTAIKDTQVIDFDSWRLACRKVNKNLSPQCRVFQNRINQKGKQLLLSAVIVMAEKEGIKFPIMRFITPKGVLISAGVGFRVDDKKQLTVPFKTCLPMGCIAEFVINDQTLLQMESGSKILVGYKIIGAKPFVVDVSLKGFTSALKALEGNARK